jgi:phage terminase large subunit-like protein
MNMEKWAKSEAKIPNIEGKKCVIGLDRSDKIDLTSLMYEFDMGNNNIFYLNHCFIPEETMEDKMLTDKVPYDAWALEGHITKIPGAKIKNSYIVDHILMMKNKYKFDLDSVAYDPWHCDDIVEDLEAEGILCIEIPQTFASLSEPTKDLRAKVYSGEVGHDGNPVLNYCMSNAVEDTDRKGNLKLWKEKKDSERIDAAVTAVISHVRMMALLKDPGDLLYSPDLD